MRWTRIALPLACGTTLWCTAAYAQAPNAHAPAPNAHAPTLPNVGAPATSKIQPAGSIVGVVTDSLNQPMEGAFIDAVDAESESKRAATTSDAAGHFVLDKLAPGKWTLVVTYPGLLSAQKSINVVAKQESIANFQLQDVEVEDIIKVQAQRNLLNRDETPFGVHIDSDIMHDYSNGNDLRKVIQTAPGVMPDAMGNIVTRGEHNAVNYIVDGVQLPEAAGVLQQTQPVSPRSLQSADVDIGGYSANQGGGPMGAVVSMRTVDIKPKPTLNIGTQLGGPLAGGINYYASSALSQDSKSVWNRVRFESSGNFFATKLGLQAPAYRFRRDGRFDLNTLTKINFDATENDRFSLTAAFNETFLHQPTKVSSRAAGFKVGEHDRQNYLILSYRHRFHKFFDEAHLHFVNAFYSQRIGSTTVFDPSPIINGEDQTLNSTAFQARRFNYAFSAQGDISKTLFKTHHLLAGFLSEARPVKTRFNEWVYNANPYNDVPYGAVISPFTGAPGGPNFQGIGNYRGFRYVQSAYLQDQWQPTAPLLRRLTLNMGVRADVYHGDFGSSTGLYRTVAAIPDIGPFSPEAFQRHRVTNAQVSGRFAANYQLTKTTLLRGSFSQLFVPPPVDILVLPFDVTGGPAGNGNFNGSPRPLQATRGNLVDAAIEQQVNSRFALRQSMFYKTLKNSGDSGVVANTMVYNRLSLAKQESYGLETRLELKPSRDGTGLYGFLSNTIAVAKLQGNKATSGGLWDTPDGFIPNKYVDHDRREVLQAALGWKGRGGFWALSDLSYFTGFKDDRSVEIFGPHRARTRPVYAIGLNMGYQIPESIRRDRAFMPASVEVRIENLTNYVAPINLGSPFQGTRYQLPIRVLAGVNWKV